MKTVRACDIVRLDAATWVRADVGLDSLARRQMDEALVANEDGPLLASQLQTKQEPLHLFRRQMDEALVANEDGPLVASQLQTKQEQRLVSTSNPDCATAASRRP